MSRRSPVAPPPYRGVSATNVTPPDPEIGEMAPFQPIAVPLAGTTMALEDAQEPQDGDEPELPGFGPGEGRSHSRGLSDPMEGIDPDMGKRLRTATETALEALPDRDLDTGQPSGKDVIVKWAARIEVLQAYKFDGKLAAAPLWIDRNWLAWDEGGGLGEGGRDVRREPGPALNVTRADGSHVGTCLKGDYVCRQNTTVDDPEVTGGLRMLPDHLAVVSAAEFERLFRPIVRQKAEAERTQAA